MSESGYFKISDIVRTGASRSEPLLPISRSTWMRGIERGIFPPPRKIFGLNVWPKEEVFLVLKKIEQGELQSAD